MREPVSEFLDLKTTQEGIKVGDPRLYSLRSASKYKIRGSIAHIQEESIRIVFIPHQNSNGKTKGY